MRFLLSIDEHIAYLQKAENLYPLAEKFYLKYGLDISSPSHFQLFSIQWLTSHGFSQTAADVLETIQAAIVKYPAIRELKQVLETFKKNKL